MREQFVFETEPFEAEAESEELASFDTELADEEEGEINRGSAAYVRWVQSALNQVLGLRLAVDGQSGTQTRSAIRSFQQRRGLTDDGEVGPRTEAALMAAGAPPPPGPGGPLTSPAPVRWVQAALNQILGLRLAVDGLLGAQTRSAVRDFQGRQGLAVTGDVDAQTEQRLVTALRASCASLRPCLTLDGFDFDKDRVLPAHQPTIIDLARCVIASQRTAEPIRLIRAVGHTDVEGSPAYNRNLGSNRARQVERHLTETLNRILPGSADGVTILAHTRGEMQPVSSDPARNRRVQLFTPVKVTTPPPACYTCANFFAEYDLRFLPRSTDRGIPANPDFGTRERGQRSDDVDALTIVPGLLVTRRDDRAAKALSGTVPAAAAAPAALELATRRLSTGQLDLYREAFPDGAGGINLASFGECFEQFANGELRAGGGGVGEPNGAFYFLFAEFAFLCIDSGIDVADWTRALKAFVMTQEIFMHIYRPRPIPGAPAVGAAIPACPPSGPRLLDAFVDSNFQQIGSLVNVGAGQSDAARKQALRVKYAPMNLAALKTAAAENLQRAQCMT